MKSSLSLIIPLSEGETQYKNIIIDLINLKEILTIDCEVLFILQDNFKYLTDFNNLLLNFPFPFHVSFSKGPRAKQMNMGARCSRKNYLWFLHADTGIDKNCIQVLLDKMKENVLELNYFSLLFDKKNAFPMNINEWGVNLRCELFDLPFGDQAFFIKKELFWKLGGLKEDVLLGEDLDFVWRAKKEGIKIIKLLANVKTSSRKYQKKGWLKTTLIHLFYTAKISFCHYLEFLERKYL